MGSLVRSRSQNLGARRVILMMWPMPLGNGPVVSLYYCEYYEDSYLMPLVVSSLTGDALQTCLIGHVVSLLEVPRICLQLLQMLREHLLWFLHCSESRGTWSRIYARELMKMPLIL